MTAAKNTILAYHGSAAEFTEFSNAFVGRSGETFGRGLYFTADRSLAESYRDKRVIDPAHPLPRPGYLYTVQLSLGPSEVLDWHENPTKNPELLARLASGGITHAIVDQVGWPRSGFDVMLGLKRLNPDTYWGPRYGEACSERLRQTGFAAISFIERDERDDRPIRGWNVLDASRIQIVAIERTKPVSSQTLLFA